MEKDFFVTCSGAFGLTIGDAQAGDEIHILIRASFPFVLRSISDEKRRRGRSSALRDSREVLVAWMENPVRGSTYQLVVTCMVWQAPLASASLRPLQLDVSTRFLLAL